MKKKATKQREDNSMGAVSVGISYASVLKKALKMLGVFENFMKYRTAKNNQGKCVLSGDQFWASFKYIKTFTGLSP